MDEKELNELKIMAFDTIYNKYKNNLSSKTKMSDSAFASYVKGVIALNDNILKKNKLLK